MQNFVFGLKLKSALWPSENNKNFELLRPVLKIKLAKCVDDGFNIQNKTICIVMFHIKLNQWAHKIL